MCRCAKDPVTGFDQIERNRAHTCEDDMAGLADSLKSELRDKFGPRVTFDRTERKLYGHDIAAVPSLIKPAKADRQLA